MANEQATAAAIVEAAESQLGVPYEWGAESPGQGFDCSGLVQFACERAGLAGCPRVSSEQIHYGPKVEGEPIAGDLVFFSGTDEPKPGHVGICVGPWEMIQAPRTGLRVERVPFGTGGVGPDEYMGATRPAALAVPDPDLVPDAQDPTPGAPAPTPYHPSYCTPSLPLLRAGERGYSVRVLQVLLGGNLTVDGVFGSLTEQAVRSFQTNKQIPVDGIVGVQTWENLIGRQVQP